MLNLIIIVAFLNRLPAGFLRFLTLLLNQCNGCCTFWPGFGCFTLQTLVAICFSVFLCKKAKKEKKQEKATKFSTKNIFLSLHQQAGQGIFLPIIVFLHMKTCYSGNNLFFAKFCTSFIAFSSFFSFTAQKRQKSIFWPAFGVRSTQTPVKINNITGSNQFFVVLGVKPQEGLRSVFLRDGPEAFAKAVRNKRKDKGVLLVRGSS